jgi:hypothetical protein
MSFAITYRYPGAGAGTVPAERKSGKNLALIFAKTLVIKVFSVVLYVCLGQTDRHSITDCPQTNGGNTMSRLTSKIVVALILGFTALTASGCTVPLTIDPGGSGLVFM